MWGHHLLTPQGVWICEDLSDCRSPCLGWGFGQTVSASICLSVTLSPFTVRVNTIHCSASFQFFFRENCSICSYGCGVSVGRDGVQYLYMLSSWNLGLSFSISVSVLVICVVLGIS